MNDFTINLEIYYLEKEKKDLEKLGDHSWSGEDFSHYIYICRRLDDLRREQNEQRQ